MSRVRRPYSAQDRRFFDELKEWMRQNHADPLIQQAGTQISDRLTKGRQILEDLKRELAREVVYVVSAHLTKPPTLSEQFLKIVRSIEAAPPDYTALRDTERAATAAEIVVLAWLLADPDADAVDFHLTSFQDWPWLESGQALNEDVGMVHTHVEGYADLSEAEKEQYRSQPLSRAAVRWLLRPRMGLSAEQEQSCWWIIVRRALDEMKRGLAAGEANQDIPRWDDDSGVLSFGDVICRSYEKKRAANQEAILRQFEEQGWPRRVMPKDKRNLNQTLKDLNKGLASHQAPIRFRGGGDGKTVYWHQNPQ